MSKTLLAVDDSVTMRKVLEITFGGEDFRVLTAESAKDALAKSEEKPDVLVVDTQLGGEDGYALAKELRRRHPQATLLLLASRYTPYDQAKGKDAGADDFADKPFDTQQLIDKVRRVMSAKEAGGGAPAAAAHPYREAPAPARPAAAAPSAPLGKGTQPSLGGAAPARSTLLFGEGSAPAPVTPQVAPRPAAAAPAAAPVVAPAPARPVTAPTPASPAVTAPSLASPTAAVAHAVTGHLAGKIEGLGLTAQQAEAVLALSREVVERVVWEVVPQLAETIIKEEITRLTRA